VSILLFTTEREVRFLAGTSKVRFDGHVLMFAMLNDFDFGLLD
jgi:hypothetical protein